MNIHEVIQEWSDRPFSYGMDCCQFAGACVESMTGRNPMAAFQYVDEASARAAIAAHGSLEDAMRDTLGEPIPIDQVADGCVLLADMANGEQIAGFAYKGRFVAKIKKGVTDWPLSYARLAWTV